MTQDYLLENPVMHCIRQHAVGSDLTLQNSHTETSVRGGNEAATGSIAEVCGLSTPSLKHSP